MRLRFFRRWSKQTGSISRLAIVRRARVKRLSRLRMMSAGCNTSRNMLLGELRITSGLCPLSPRAGKRLGACGDTWETFRLGNLSAWNWMIRAGFSFGASFAAGGWLKLGVVNRSVKTWLVGSLTNRLGGGASSRLGACCSAKIRCYLVVEGCLSGYRWL